jgi:hypothetical protein
MYVFSLTLCFLLFKQSDLTHTYASSYAYLNGHIFDFYDYNKVYFIGNDYLPLLYVFFAVWNVPLKLLNLLPDITSHNWMITTPVEVIWSKLMLVTFFFGSVFIIQKIFQLLEIKKIPLSADPSILFATSPFAIFAVFVFSQYDIVGVFFSLLGLYFYFRKDFVRFALLFSVAISFKYFAVLIYAPLVLLVEKRLIYLVGYMILGLLVTLLQIAMYWHSEVFSSHIFSLAMSKGSEASHRGIAVLIGIAYLAICVFAYLKKSSLTLKSGEWARDAIFCSLFAYCLMFLLVRWHPQWLIIVAPFFALACLYLTEKYRLLIMEIIGYISFIWICVNVFDSDVGVNMLSGGVFASHLPDAHRAARNILSPHLLLTAKVLFNLLLLSPALLLLHEKRGNVFKHPIFKRFSLSGGAGARDLATLSPIKRAAIFDARFLIGAYFFPLILLLCFI